MRIAVCSLAYGEQYKKKTAVSQHTKQLYCKKHNYDYIEDETVVDISRPLAWSKVLLLQKYLPSYDILVWIDADAMIMNLDQNLEEKIQLMKETDIMVLGKTKIDINTGVIFIKNSPYSNSLLSRLYSMTDFINSTSWEQTAFIHIYENEPDTREHILVLDNSYTPVIQSYWFEYKHDHFIVHFSGCSLQLDSLESSLNSFTTIKLNNETVERYDRRMYWLKNIAYSNIDMTHGLIPFQE